ncbi:hypothetical protein GE300_18510 [Rhodobacteraceae bacterium 2CG4]|uniref:Uncharacterized protein n=1 Tax=Halovulum marinum TaxID=2662447 RepID=A0A6L5Z6A7_9RHOB|nr:hypothetical protein [Halovulum marinum]MSU91575.1 hypothetical protein [Halovulum marinum]
MTRLTRISPAAPLALLATLLLSVPAPASAQAQDPEGCGQVSPRLLQQRLSRSAGQGQCLASEIAARLQLSAERVCYQTGLPETQRVEARPAPRTRTIRVRRGTEVQEVKLVSKQPLEDIVDIRDSLDTVFLDVDATLCMSPDQVRVTSGNWEIRGYDAGTSFSASGYFPTSRLGVRYLPQSDGLAIDFDLPAVQLEQDPEPRRIAGSVAMPLR